MHDARFQAERKPHNMTTVDHLITLYTRKRAVSEFEGAKLQLQYESYIHDHMHTPQHHWAYLDSGAVILDVGFLLEKEKI